MKFFKRKNFRDLFVNNSFVKYDKSSKATDYFSSACDSRIIWGGDDTINQVRKSPLPARSTDIAFSDRFSFGND